MDDFEQAAWLIAGVSRIVTFEFYFSAFMLLDTRFNKLTETVIGCAMRVHKLLGTGFQETIYQRSLAVELEQAGVVFGRELEMPIFYKGAEVGSRRVDFLVEETVLVSTH